MNENTIPNKPPLRPVLMLIRDSFNFFTKNLWLLIPVYLVYFLVIFLFQILKPLRGHLVLSLLNFAIFFIAGVIYATALNLGIILRLKDYTVSFLDLYKGAFKIFPKAFKTIFISKIIIILGFILLIAPGVLFMLWYIFIIPIILLEDLSGMAALRFSKRVFRSNPLKVVGNMALIALIAFAVYKILFLILGIPSGCRSCVCAPAGVSKMTIFSFFTGITNIWYVVFIVMLYKDLRAGIPENKT